jgi:hypothetical protein
MSNAGGALKFTELLDAMPDVVRVDRSVKPPWSNSSDRVADAGHAIGGEREQALPTLPTGLWRLRSDLWAAILSSDPRVTYVWDDGVVKALPSSEIADDDPRPKLPTATGDEIRAWREDFAARHAGTASGADVHRWATDSSTSWALERPLRDLWFTELEDRVRTRVEEWFESEGLAAPGDLIEQPPPRASQRAGVDTESIAALRAVDAFGVFAERSQLVRGPEWIACQAAVEAQSDPLHPSTLGTSHERSPSRTAPDTIRFQGMPVIHPVKDGANRPRLLTATPASGLR